MIWEGWLFCFVVVLRLRLGCVLRFGLGCCDRLVCFVCGGLVVLCVYAS